MPDQLRTARVQLFRLKRLFKDWMSTRGTRLSNASFGDVPTRDDKIIMRDGDTMLIMVQNGEVVHFTSNMGLPHSEFVKRTTGQLLPGAWVGTVSKLEGDVAAITSKYFFGYQLPAPSEVLQAVRRKFR